MGIIDYSIIVVYLLGMVAVGLYFQRKASSDIDSYFLGSRNIPWWALGISGMASNLDVTGTMVVTAMLFVMGMNGFFVEYRGGVCVVLVFMIAFIGKWNRRSKVMTMAEWMHYRFGKGLDGDCARLIFAIFTLVSTIAMITYFCKGAGKFAAEFMNIPPFLGLPPDFWAAIIMIALAMIYTVASGLQGVVWTDVFQSLLIFITIISVAGICFFNYSLPEKFTLSTSVNNAKLTQYNKNNPDNQILTGHSITKSGKEYTLKESKGKKYLEWETTKSEWTSLKPKHRFSFPDITSYSMFNLMAICIFFYFFRALLEGFGGSGSYMTQRLFAAKNEREAGLLSLFWTFLLSFRWLFMVSLCVMGIYLSTKAPITDPEMVLPNVIDKLIPMGLKGLLVAGLVSAAMSTFDSTVNCGASYWVKDIYQAFINPKASEKQLVKQSKISSVIVVGIALLLSLTVTSINEIWNWITMALAGGMFIPVLARWYWWRLNGWGFSAGVGVGMVSAIFVKLLLPVNAAAYTPFLISCGASLLALIIVTLLTKPNDEEVLYNYYKSTKPFGIWGHIKAKLPTEQKKLLTREHILDIVSLIIAIPWQTCLYMLFMTFVTKDISQMIILIIIVIVLSIVLYFTWFKHLSDYSEEENA
jgi:solute:Na+ symporter, SSS family